MCGVDIVYPAYPRLRIATSAAPTIVSVVLFMFNAINRANGKAVKPISTEWKSGPLFMTLII